MPVLDNDNHLYAIHFYMKSTLSLQRYPFVPLITSGLPPVIGAILLIDGACGGDTGVISMLSSRSVNALVKGL